MVVLKIDLHTHTDHSDSSATLDEITRYAKRKGIDGVAVTDRMTCEALSSLCEEINGVLVVSGLEVETYEGHLLVLGVRSTPPRCMSLLQAVKWARQHGGVVIAAHPTVPGFRIPFGLLAGARPDAIETLNGKVPLEKWNLESALLALRLGLPQTGGSDSHSAETVGDAYTLIEAEDLSLTGILDAIRVGRVRPGGNCSAFRHFVFTMVYGALSSVAQELRKVLQGLLMLVRRSF